MKALPALSYSCQGEAQRNDTQVYIVYYLLHKSTEVVTKK